MTKSKRHVPWENKAIMDKRPNLKQEATGEENYHSATNKINYNKRAITITA